jgi:hypothetical protein
MFIMMNAARFHVGVQGIAVAERAYQKAVAYARDRVQSRAPEGSAGPVAIIRHPDVRRLLMFMRSHTEAARAVAYVAAGYNDIAHAHPDAETRKLAKAAYEYLVPVVKGFSTEMSIEVASAGVQVHGGMGFIEETGAAQHYRDARILTIYEGTTAIQANDLVGRKTARDGGRTARAIAAQVQATEEVLAARSSAACRNFARRLGASRLAFLDAVDFIVAQAKANPNAVYAGSVPYLMLAGTFISGWQMGRALMAAEDRLTAGEDEDFMRAKIATASFHADHILNKAAGLRDSIVEGADSVTALALEAF